MGLIKDYSFFIFITIYDIQMENFKGYLDLKNSSLK